MKTLIERLKKFACNHGIHSWKQNNDNIYARHRYVECECCGKREIWKHYNPHTGYQPVDESWIKK